MYVYCIYVLYIYIAQYILMLSVKLHYSCCALNLQTSFFFFFFPLQLYTCNGGNWKYTVNTQKKGREGLKEKTMFPLFYF